MARQSILRVYDDDDGIVLRERETIGPCLVGGGNCSSMTVGIELGGDLKSVDTIRGSSPGYLEEMMMMMVLMVMVVLPTDDDDDDDDLAN